MGFLRLKRLKIKLYLKNADRTSLKPILKELSRKRFKMGFLGRLLKNCGSGLNLPILGFLEPKSLILGVLKNMTWTKMYNIILENLLIAPKRRGSMGQPYSLEIENGKVLLKKEREVINSWPFTPGLFEKWVANELFLNIIYELAKDNVALFEAKVIASLLVGRIEEKIKESKYFGSKA